MRISFWRFAAAALVATSLAGCQSESDLDSLPPLESATVDTAAFRLGRGDHVALVVFDSPNLSSPDLNVAADGTVALPLAGTVKALGLTLDELTEAVRQKLMDGYLRDPKVSVQIVSYRPFYILGEVKTPGEYPYVPGMTVTAAAARAGGFTFRAYEDAFSVTRDGAKYRATDTSKLLPDDVVKIPARIF